MKADIHPTTHETMIKCSCGHEIQSISTLADIHISICSACHPFYTGKQKLLDTAGRVEKFKQRYAQKQNKPAEKQKRTITIKS